MRKVYCNSLLYLGTYNKVFVDRRINLLENKSFDGQEAAQKGDRGPKRREVRKLAELFASNQIFISCRLPSIDRCSLGEESFFFAFFRKLVSFNCNIEDLSALDAPFINSVN